MHRTVVIAKKKTRKTVYTDYERKPPNLLLLGTHSVSTTAERKQCFEFLRLLGNEMLARSHMVQWCTKLTCTVCFRAVTRFFSAGTKTKHQTGCLPQLRNLVSLFNHNHCRQHLTVEPSYRLSARVKKSVNLVLRLMNVVFSHEFSPHGKKSASFN